MIIQNKETRAKYTMTKEKWEALSSKRKDLFEVIQKDEEPKQISVKAEIKFSPKEKTHKQENTKTDKKDANN